MKKLLIPLALVALLTGCSYRVYPSDIDWAIEACGDKGGIHFVRPETNNGYFNVVCNNGSMYIREHGRRQQ